MLSEMNRGKNTSFLSLIWFFSEVAWPGAYCAPQDLGLGGARGLLGVWLGRGLFAGLASWALELRWLAQPRFVAAS